MCIYLLEILIPMCTIGPRYGARGAKCEEDSHDSEPTVHEKRINAYDQTNKPPLQLCDLTE